MLGKLPTVEEYVQYAGKIDSKAPEVYRYLNFDKMPAFVDSAQHARDEVIVKLAV